VSYLWDDLIERTAANIREQKEYYTTFADVREGERLLRVLAQESRFRRRTLARNLIQVASYDDPNHNRFARTLAPGSPTETCYIFMSLKNPLDMSYDKYREARREMLKAYSMGAKLKFPDTETIIGIATEYGSPNLDSHDLSLFDARHFTASDKRDAERLRRELELYVTDRQFEVSEDEYPQYGWGIHK
jgi:hypothetical protein